MNSQLTQKKVVLGSTLKAINSAKRTGNLDLKAIKVANIIKKLRENVITDNPCVNRALDRLFTNVQRKYKLCNYRDKVINNLNTNMATYTINISAQINQSATFGDGASAIPYGTNLVFTRALLTTSLSPAYSDPEGDPALNFRVDTLPVDGTLNLNGVAVLTGQVISYSDIDAGLLVYNSSLVDTDGDIESFDFNIADAGSTNFATTGATYTITIQPQINQPPSQLGDGESTIAYGASLTFTRALLTTMLVPAYVDPEGDAAQNLRVNALPIRGTLELNGTPISAGQVISFLDIDASLLIYQPDLADTDGDQVTFDFSVSDVGSGQFIT